MPPLDLPEASDVPPPAVAHSEAREPADDAQTQEQEQVRWRQQRAPLTGLVLSGGGARGAYEAGVIRYIRDELPPRVRAHAR